MKYKANKEVKNSKMADMKAARLAFKLAVECFRLHLKCGAY